MRFREFISGALMVVAVVVLASVLVRAQALPPTALDNSLFPPSLRRILHFVRLGREEKKERALHGAGVCPTLKERTT